MKFSGIQKTSLIDFPGKMATVLFTPDCNLRCPYCHNWRIVVEPSPPFLDEASVLQILESRKKFVNAVVVTGGEPTIHRDLPEFLKMLKEADFYLKLDTNGFFPLALLECIPHVDYVALDVKTSLDQYPSLGTKSTSNFLRSVEILKKDPVDYEFRTTAVPGFVSERNIEKIGEIVKGSRRFALQQFTPGDTLDETFNDVKPYTKIQLTRFAESMKRYVSEVAIRM